MNRFFAASFPKVPEMDGANVEVVWCLMSMLHNNGSNENMLLDVDVGGCVY